MATKHVTVVKTHVMLVEIQDELLTPEAVEEFETGMFDIEANINGLFAYAATMASNGYNNVEGLGAIGNEVRVQELDTYYDTYIEEVNEQ